MRILVIHQFYLENEEPGGSRFNEMCKVWVENGHYVEVIAGMVNYNIGHKNEKYKGKLFYKDVINSNLIIHRCHVSESYNLNFIGRVWAYLSFALFGSWASLFKIGSKFDIVIVTSPPLFVGIIALVYKWVKRTPFVFEIRDMWPESAIDTGVLTNKIIIKIAFWFESVLYKQAALINPITPLLHKLVKQKKKCDAEKLIYIPNGADVTIGLKSLENIDLNKFRIENGWDNKFVAIYVGAFGVSNHLQQLISTAEILQSHKDILIVCVGDGMMKESLVNEVISKNLSNIVFLPSVSKYEIFKYIYSSDVGLSVLKNIELFKTAYSNKTFDYMVCKKPIILAIDGISKEMIETANCGIAVQPENAEAIANAILYYYNNKEIINLHGINGYLYAIENFDREKLAKKYIESILSKNVIK
jgi:glycosyltransferase involved in cell wall biosynthesis